MTKLIAIFTLLVLGASVGITLIPLYESIEVSSTVTESRADERACKDQLIRYEDGNGECQRSSKSTENAWESGTALVLVCAAISVLLWLVACLLRRPDIGAWAAPLPLLLVTVFVWQTAIVTVPFVVLGIAMSSAFRSSRPAIVDTAHPNA